VVGADEYVLGNIGRRNKPRQSYGFMKPVVRRASLVKYGIRFRALRCSEDYLFALHHLIYGARWVVTPEPLYRYTVRVGSLTDRHSLAVERAHSWRRFAEALKGQAVLRRSRQHDRRHPKLHAHHKRGCPCRSTPLSPARASQTSGLRVSRPTISRNAMKNLRAPTFLTL